MFRPKLWPQNSENSKGFEPTNHHKSSQSPPNFQRRFGHASFSNKISSPKEIESKDSFPQIQQTESIHEQKFQRQFKAKTLSSSPKFNSIVALNSIIPQASQRERIKIPMAKQKSNFMKEKPQNFSLLYGDSDDSISRQDKFITNSQLDSQQQSLKKISLPQREISPRQRFISPNRPNEINYAAQQSILSKEQGQQRKVLVVIPSIKSPQNKNSLHQFSQANQKGQRQNLTEGNGDPNKLSKCKIDSNSMLYSVESSLFEKEASKEQQQMIIKHEKQIQLKEIYSTKNDGSASTKSKRTTILLEKKEGNATINLRKAKSTQRQESVLRERKAQEDKEKNNICLYNIEPRNNYSLKNRNHLLPLKIPNFDESTILFEQMDAGNCNDAIITPKQSQLQSKDFGKGYLHCLSNINNSITQQLPKLEENIQQRSKQFSSQGSQNSPINSQNSYIAFKKPQTKQDVALHPPCEKINSLCNLLNEKGDQKKIRKESLKAERTNSPVLRQANSKQEKKENQNGNKEKSGKIRQFFRRFNKVKIESNADYQFQQKEINKSTQQSENLCLLNPQIFATQDLLRSPTPDNLIESSQDGSQNGDQQELSKFDEEQLEYVQLSFLNSFSIFDPKQPLKSLSNYLIQQCKEQIESKRQTITDNFLRKLHDAKCSLQNKEDEEQYFSSKDNQLSNISTNKSNSFQREYLDGCKGENKKYEDNNNCSVTILEKDSIEENQSTIVHKDNGASRKSIIIDFNLDNSKSQLSCLSTPRQMQNEDTLQQTLKDRNNFDAIERDSPTLCNHLQFIKKNSQLVRPIAFNKLNNKSKQIIEGEENKTMSQHF